MFFIIFAKDKPDSTAKRAETKPRHMKHLDGGMPMVRVLQSGPLLSDYGAEHGSLIVVEAADKLLVEEFFRRDPYVEAGLFNTFEIHEWLWRRGNPYNDEQMNQSKP